MFLAIVCIESYADTLYLKNGSQFKGYTVKQDGKKVIFRVGSEDPDGDGIESTFLNEEVLRIDKTGASNFISLPFGQQQQIVIPRPAAQTDEPLITERIRSQLGKQAGVTQDVHRRLVNLPNLLTGQPLIGMMNQDSFSWHSKFLLVSSNRLPKFYLRPGQSALSQVLQGL